jgi:hypothetical protein
VLSSSLVGRRMNFQSENLELGTVFSVFFQNKNKEIRPLSSSFQVVVAYAKT